MTKKLAFYVLLFISNLVLTTDIFSQTCPGGSGCLDETYGGGGKVLTSVNFGTGSCWANGAAIQPSDGKIVVAAFGNNYPAGTGNDFYVLRYETNGELDASFGSGGIARFAFTAAADGESPSAIAVQSDGKIVVAGTAPSGGAVARLNTDGSLDATFASGGKFVFKFSTKEAAVLNGLAIQADGKVVVAGRSNSKIAFARLTSSGGFDTSFNGTGKFTLQVSGGSADATINEVAVQPDGKIVGVGSKPGSGKNSSERDLAVVRLNGNGSLDASFGSSGQVYTDFADAGLGDTIWDSARALTILWDAAVPANSRLLVAGSALLRIPSGTRYLFAKYTLNGQLDTSFGNGGKVLTGIADHNRIEGDVFVQADGKIVASGNHMYSGIAGDLALVRLQSNGSVDGAFGNSGVVSTDIAGSSEIGNALVVQSDGKYVVVGFANGGNNIVLTRYLP